MWTLKTLDSRPPAREAGATVPGPVSLGHSEAAGGLGLTRWLQIVSQIGAYTNIWYRPRKAAC